MEVSDFVIMVIPLLFLMLFVIIRYFAEVIKMGQLTCMQNLVILGWWEVEISDFVIIVMPLLSLLLFVII